MSYQEKKNIINILSAVLIAGVYFWYVFESHPEEGMETGELLKFWAQTLLIYMPVTIGARIAIYIVFAIVNKIATNEDLPSLTDERDKLIELKSNRISHYTFTAGFILSMGALAADYSVNVMFVILIVSGLISEIFENISQLYFHRRGI
jgi:hypothetical protein